MVKKNKAVLFTDIKSSSKLWAKYGSLMSKALDTHDKQIRLVLTKHNGMILKTIGDAYMILFDTLEQSFNFSTELVTLMKQVPIYLNTSKTSKDVLRIRMGFCFGKVDIKKVNIQNKSLIDVFGSTVNKASRMESKVSDVGGFAFCRDDNKHINLDNNKKIKSSSLSGSNDLNIVHIEYANKCVNKGKRYMKRSLRLLSSEQQTYECKQKDELHGVGKVHAYKLSF